MLKTGHIAIAALAMVTVSLSSPSWGQSAEACGRGDDHLFSCTFDKGARKVALCNNNGLYTYSFGPTQGPPGLSMTRRAQDIEYTPFSWASNIIFESVAFLNGDTSYEVFSSTARGPYDGLTEGGILVTRPNASSFTLTCDAKTVWPKDPLEGIGQLNGFINDDTSDALSRCLQDLPDHIIPSQCLGHYRDIQIVNDTCDVSRDKTRCWQIESDQWAKAMQNAYTKTLAAVENHGDDQLAHNLKASQASWAQTRNLDCRVKGVLPFSPDAGFAMCRAEYAADRIGFFNAVTAFSEFGG